MSVSLKKGGTVSLSKEAKNLGISSLSKVAVGLGWDCHEIPGITFDLDAWAMAVTDGEIQVENFVYFANKADSSRNIIHMGDNLTGEGDGDDETIQITLDKLPSTYERILIGVTIYKANSKGQSFKDVNNAFIRIYDTVSGIEICKYEDEFKGELGNSVTMLFGILYKENGQWQFTSIGNGSNVCRMSQLINVYNNYTFSNIETNNNKNGGKKHMAVSLSKGGKVSLAKVAADAGIQGGLTKIIVGLGWDVNRYSGGFDFDLDAAAFLQGANGKVRNENDFVFYNNVNGAGVTHTGDNKTGDGEGDDEQIKVDLTAVPADVEKVAFTVTIHDATARNQNFGMVENSYIHILDEVTGTELVRYDLGEDFSMETAIVVAELYRNNGEWKFNAIGSGFDGGLAALCANFGIDAE